VDSNADLVEPHPSFTTTKSRFCLVQTTSPQPRRWKAWAKQLSAPLAVMKPWSWEEMCIGGSNFEEPPIDVTILRTVFTKFGASPRHCYELARDPVALREWEDRVTMLLQQLPYLPSMYLNMTGSGYSDEAFTKTHSQIVTMVPKVNRRPDVTMVTRHITHLMYDNLLVSDAKFFLGVLQFVLEGDGKPYCGGMALGS